MGIVFEWIVHNFQGLAKTVKIDDVSDPAAPKV